MIEVVSASGQNFSQARGQERKRDVPEDSVGYRLDMLHRQDALLCCFLRYDRCLVKNAFASAEDSSL